MSFLCVSLCVSLEEDGDEIKIGTSCKNGGCLKVGEYVSVCWENINCYALEMEVINSIHTSVGLWQHPLESLFDSHL